MSVVKAKVVRWVSIWEIPESWRAFYLWLFGVSSLLIFVVVTDNKLSVGEYTSLLALSSDVGKAAGGVILLTAAACLLLTIITRGVSDAMVFFKKQQAELEETKQNLRREGYLAALRDLGIDPVTREKTEDMSHTEAEESHYPYDPAENPYEITENPYDPSQEV